jgi:hypothetical protein
MWISYIWQVASLTIHAICLVTLMGVKIQWVVNGYCNSKIKLQAQL